MMTLPTMQPRKKNTTVQISKPRFTRLTSLCSTNLVALYQPIWFASISFSITLTILVVFNKIYLGCGIVYLINNLVIIMNRLRDLREDADMSQVQVGKILGLSSVAIGRYETEQRQLTPDLIAKFCALYHVSSDYLLGFSDVRTPAAVAAAEAAPDLNAMAQTIASFTPEQTELFLELVKLMKQNEK